MAKEPRSEEYMRRVQNYGEQHPDFNASHREYKRRFPEVFGVKKKREVAKKMRKTTKTDQARKDSIKAWDKGHGVKGLKGDKYNYSEKELHDYHSKRRASGEEPYEHSKTQKKGSFMP